LNIDPKDAPDRLALFFAKRVDPWHRHLAPAARRTPKIDDPRTRHQKAELVIHLHDLEGRAPPDTIVVHPDGRLTYRGKAIASPQAFYAARPEDEREVVRIVSDEALSAITLVNLARDFRTLGASRVVIVTRRGLE
jgi:biopolymer transport protein ExbD